MIDCLCKTSDGYVNRKALNYNEYTINFNFKYETKEYSTVYTLDIETSRYCLNKELEEFVTYIYQWQMCDENGTVIFGRKVESLIFFLKKLNYSFDKKVVIYVHNLSYEFHFIKDFLDFDNVFAVDRHTVLKATSDNLEFRCSYKLSNMSLLKFIENTPNHYLIKGKGDLDYSILRTPNTTLNVKELGYCYNDVYCLMHSIKYLLKDDDLKSIPLTSTGYVRRECRISMRNKDDRKIFNKTKIEDIHIYNLIYECFRGGNTASNRYHTNNIIDDVHSFDMTSAYPYVMMTEYFPYSKFMYGTINDVEELDYYNSNYCTFALYRFKNMRLYDKTPIPYLAFSKVRRISKENTCYNGRIIDCDYVEVMLTNVDFDVVDSMYDYDDLIVEDFYFSKKKKLPRSLRNVIMKYFNEKTQLKNVDYYFYMKSKNRLNSIYGMLVSKIVRDEYFFNGSTIELNDNVDAQLMLDKFNNSRNSFLIYQWGVWVTAYCRRNLQRAINEIGVDVVYCDTDSVKFINDHDDVFEKINNEILNNTYDIDIYSVKDEKKYYLGVWEKEKSYDKFITLGAKKYAYMIDDEIGVTVSGLNKENAKIELKEKGGLEYFKNGEVFTNSGRKSVEYVNRKEKYIKIGEEKILSGSCINMFDVEYTLGITDTMLDIIDSLK